MKYLQKVFHSPKPLPPVPASDRPRTNVCHDPHPWGCHPDCPVWKAEALEEKRQVWRLRKEIEDMALAWHESRKDWKAVEEFRAFQQAYPNHYPRS